MRINDKGEEILIVGIRRWKNPENMKAGSIRIRRKRKRRRILRKKGRKRRRNGGR